jgi:hypothetical protein
MVQDNDVGRVFLNVRRNRVFQCSSSAGFIGGVLDDFLVGGSRHLDRCKMVGGAPLSSLPIAESLTPSCVLIWLLPWRASCGGRVIGYESLFTAWLQGRLLHGFRDALREVLLNYRQNISK